MATDLEEFERMIKEGKITSVDEMLKKSREYAKEIPNFEENFNKIVKGRGYVLELSTILEIAFNEMIVKICKKEIHNIPFMKKAKIVKKLLEEINNGDFSEEVLKKFERFVNIRNIFAHVPINRNRTSLKLEFNSKPPYKSFFEIEPKWENVSVAVKDYMDMAGEILTTIPKYIEKIIQMEKEKALQDIIDKIIMDLTTNEEADE